MKLFKKIHNNNRNFIKNVWRVFQYDLNHIRKNWVAMVIMGALAVLPALYAWFNIAAMWDPYSNTKSMKIAVVNEDAGSQLMDLDLELGEQIITNLQSNDSLGWQFMETEDQAMDAVKKGKVYAAIVIPADFSEKMATVFDREPEYPKLRYYENQKMNPVAPKITQKGASTIQETVNKEFIAQITEVVFESLNKAGGALENNYSDLIFYKDLIVKLNGRFPTIMENVEKLVKAGNKGDELLAKIQDDIPIVENILNNSMGFTENLETDYQDLQKKLSDSVGIVDNNLTLTSSMLSSINTSFNDLYRSTKSGASDEIDAVLLEIEQGKKDVGELQTLLSDLSKDGAEISDLSVDVAKELLAQLNLIEDLLNKIENGDYDINDVAYLLSDVRNTVKQIRRQLRELSDMVNENLVPALQTGAKGIEALIKSLEQGNTDLKQSIDSAVSGLETNKAVLSRLLDAVNKLPAHKLLVKQIQAAMETTDRVIAYLNDLKKEADLANKDGVVSKLNQLLVDLKLDVNGLASELRGFFFRDLDDLLLTLQEVSRKSAALIRGSSSDISGILDSTTENVGTIKEILNKYLAIVQRLDESKVTQNAENRVAELLNKLDDYSAKLETAKNNINNDEKFSEIVEQLNVLNASMEDEIQHIQDDYKTVTKPRLDRFLDNAIIMNQDIGVLLKDVNQGLNEFHSIIAEIRQGGSDSIEKLDQFNKEKMPKLKDTLQTLSDVFAFIDGNVDMNKLLAVLSNDPEKEKDFLSEAVKLDTVPVFPMPNYGSALAPFFTILCLWVGATLLGAMLSVESKCKDVIFTPKQVYVGKFMIFALMGVLQGVIVCLGDLFIIRSHIVHPFVFTLVGVLAALTFNMIMYTLVSLLDNVGKAVSIVMLVLQIAAAGGTFPIQVTPPFFQMISPFIPFTYGIGAMREAAGGIVPEILMKDILLLLAFFVGFFFIGFLFKKPINTLLEKFKKKWHEAQLSE